MGKKTEALKKAYNIAKKVGHEGKEILQAMPTVNTDQLNNDFGNTFNSNPEHFFSFEEAPKRHSNRHQRKLRPRKVVYY